MPASPRWVAALWRRVQAQPGVGLDQDAGAVVAQADAAGVGADVTAGGARAARRARAAVGAEQWAGVAAFEVAGQQERGASAPDDPVGVAAFGGDAGATGDRPKPWEVNLLPLLPAAVVPPVVALASGPPQPSRGVVRAR